MKTTIKRLTSGILAAAMIFGSSVTTFAETSDKNFSAASTVDDKELPVCEFFQSYEADEESVFFEWRCWGAKRFYVYQKIDGKYKRILDTADNPDADSRWDVEDGEEFVDGGGLYVHGLKPYTGYAFKVCALIPNEKTGKYDKFYSKYIKCRTYPSKAKIKSAKSTKSTITINWNKVKCEGYKIQVLDTKKDKWVTKKTVGKSVKTARITGLKSNTRYKLRVVAFGRTAKGTRVSPDYKTTPSTVLWAKPAPTKTVRTKKR